jgi:hypothetical protein
MIFAIQFSDYFSTLFNRRHIGDFSVTQFNTRSGSPPKEAWLDCTSIKITEVLSLPPLLFARAINAPQVKPRLDLVCFKISPISCIDSISDKPSEHNR